MTREEEDAAMNTAETLLNAAIDRLKVAFAVAADRSDAGSELSRCQVNIDLANTTVTKLRRSFAGRAE